MDPIPGYSIYYVERYVYEVTTLLAQYREHKWQPINESLTCFSINDVHVSETTL